MSIAAGSRELAWMTRRVLRGASSVIANSENTAGMLRQQWHVPGGKLHTLNPGVNAGRFFPANRDMAVRRRLGPG